jgi:hypothetical protein
VFAQRWLASKKKANHPLLAARWHPDV